MSRQINLSFIINISIFILLIIAAYQISTSSLWIDEAISLWIIKDSITTCAERAINFQGQSPFYYCSLWIFTRIFGFSELSLRCPSFLAIILTTILFYNFIKSKLSEDIASFSTFFLVASLTTSISVLSARPYGFAMLFSLLSTIKFFKIINNPSKNDYFLYILFNILLFLSHYLYGSLILLQFILFFILRNREKSSITAYLLGLACTAAASLYFSISQFELLANKRQLFSITNLPTLKNLIEAFNFTGLLTPWMLLIIILSAFFLRRDLKSIFITHKTKLLLISIFTAFPIISIFIFSHIINTPLFVPRYYEGYTFGFSCLLGTVFSLFVTSNLRLILFCIASCIIVSKQIYTPIFSEDWKSAVSFADFIQKKSSIILFSPGYIETANADWMKNSNNRDYLLAPLSAYSNSITMPVILPLDRGIPEVNDIVSQVRPSSMPELLLISRRLFVSNSRIKDEPSEKYLTDWLISLGYQNTSIRFFGDVFVAEYLARN